MECSRTWQLRARDASVANSTARLLRTGSAPGKPRQTGQTLVFGGDPKRLTHPQKALVSVRSWTWDLEADDGFVFGSDFGEIVAAVAMGKSSLASGGVPPPPWVGTVASGSIGGASRRAVLDCGMLMKMKPLCLDLLAGNRGTTGMVERGAVWHEVSSRNRKAARGGLCF